MQELKRSDFNYDLPDERIARHPVEDRDSSRLLVYRQGGIEDRHFRDLADHLPEQCLLVFNNAKVIPARLFFKRATGATIELLLLEPFEASYETVFHQKQRVRWKCMVGNLKKWKDGEVLESLAIPGLTARLLDRAERLVELGWQDEREFASILEEAGKLPIPPYLNRDTEERDYTEYQTVYATKDGSVAAPTAGLHFTRPLMEALRAKGIGESELTLHVGAGTFLPVKDENVLDHPMHREHFEVRRSELQRLIEAPCRVAVGTTSLRVLESLYYLGLQLHNGMEGRNVTQFEPYTVDPTISYAESLGCVLTHMDAKGWDVFRASTEIMILPDYRIRSIDALITNFHLPESTLLMLIASVVGDAWRSIYAHALRSEYRFLSYGDSSLLFLE